MTHHRYGKERVYDFLENVAPTHLRFAMSEKESEEFLLHKAIAHLGLTDARTFRAVWKNIREQPVNLEVAQSKLDAMVESGQIAAFQLEGTGSIHYCLASDLPLLETIQRGEIPQSWQSLETSTLEEVTFLSPLEYVSARRRALKLFDLQPSWNLINLIQQCLNPISYGSK
jgi:uncharacterized protein YcaQ